MWHGWMHGAGGWGPGMGLMMFLFWILVVAGVVLLAWFVASLGRRAQPPPSPPGPETALEVLRKRYARGEVTREQYQEMKRDLEG
jgi:putative membrane protein